MASFILTQDVRERRENLHPKISLPITTECARSVIRRLRQQAKKVSQIRQSKKWLILLKSMISSFSWAWSTSLDRRRRPRPIHFDRHSSEAKHYLSPKGRERRREKEREGGREERERERERRRRAISVNRSDLGRSVGALSENGSSPIRRKSTSK